MKNKDNVTYLAIFTKEDDEYNIEIPALQGGYTFSSTIEEGISYCQEVIGLILSDEKYKKEPYPEDVKIEKIKLKDNQFFVFVNVYLPYQFSLIKEVYKNKMLTIPTWLEALAKNKNINFSRVLQEGLKKELNIKEQ